MKLEKSICIEGIGDIKLIKKKNVKYIRITVKSPDIVRVTLPYLASFTAAEKFIEAKTDWIIKSLNKNKQKKVPQTIFRDNLKYSTTFHTFTIVRNGSPNIKLIQTNNNIEIQIPNSVDIEKKGYQDKIKGIIEDVLRSEAKSFLPNRVNHFSKYYNIRISRLSFRKAKTVWGSCSSKNNISLNIHLMRLPSHLIDYVIIHELCHVDIKNHSPYFWDKLEQMLPGAKELSKELKQYSPTIF